MSQIWIFQILPPLSHVMSEQVQLWIPGSSVEGRGGRGWCISKTYCTHSVKIFFLHTLSWKDSLFTPFACN